MRPWRALFVLILGAAVAGCSTTSVQEAEEGRSPAQVNTQLGVGYMKRGDYELALEKFQRAIRLDPRYTDAHTGIAVLYEQIGRQELAERHYRKAVELKPDNGNVHNNLGTFLCKKGEHEQAEEHFLKALEDPFYRTPQVAYANAGTCALRIPAPERAERYLRLALEEDPEYADALFRLAEMMYRRGEHLNARAFMERYLAAAGVSADALFLAARIERELGDRRAAARYASRLQNDFPDSPEARQLAEQNDNGR